MKNTLKFGMIIMFLFAGIHISNAQFNIANKIKRNVNKKAKLKKKPKLEDKGITSDIHGKYVGKIVWSKEKISYKYPDDSKFVSDFNADEYIFGRLYLNESVQNTVYKNTGDELDWIHI